MPRVSRLRVQTKRFFNIGHKKNHERPNADWYPEQAAAIAEVEHGKDAGGHCQGPHFESEHIHPA